MIRFVYVAGPYSRPLPNHNVNKAIGVADQLMALGFVPYVPHLTHLWDTVSPHSYEQWMALDFAWIERCDALLRIPGESSGADREVAHARARGIPVFDMLAELLGQSRPRLRCEACGGTGINMQHSPGESRSCEYCHGTGNA